MACIVYGKPRHNAIKMQNKTFPQRYGIFPPSERAKHAHNLAEAAGAIDSAFVLFRTVGMPLTCQLAQANGYL
jgi:hypothetical protein